MKTTSLTKTVLAATAIMIASCGSAPTTKASPNKFQTPASIISPSSVTAPRMPRTIGLPFVVSGNGFEGVHFGQRASIVIAKLIKTLGHISRLTVVSAPGNCTIDSYINWPTVTVYFDNDRFVGYATGNLIGENKQIPNVSTTKGLKIGDTIAEAKAIYGNAFQTSYAQGGSWAVTTPHGKFAGYLTEEIGQTNPPPQIADITAGSVGCPAASP